VTSSLLQTHVTPKPGHVESRLDGWKPSEWKADVLRLQVTHSGSAPLALYSHEPRVIEDVSSGSAQLLPVWDGTIGYSHSRLELTEKQSGESAVRLGRIPPPDKTAGNHE